MVYFICGNRSLVGGVGVWIWRMVEVGKIWCIGESYRLWDYLDSMIDGMRWRRKKVMDSFLFVIMSFKGLLGCDNRKGVLLSDS